jgi:trehalose-6-phosphate synthase
MSVMMSFTKKFVSHNFASQPATQNLDISSTSENSVEEDLAAELQKSISNVFTGKSVKRTDNFTELQEELKLFEAFGTKTKKLEKITSALETIQPSSTTSERTFLVARASPQVSEIPCSINCLTQWYWYKNKREMK